ncbi:MAG: ribonuclease PH [Gemmatimonadales bacterium]
MARPDGRRPDELRRIQLDRNSHPYAEGSCLTQFGDTVVLCTASVLDSVPPWRRGSGKGWLTAEYAMLPRATLERTARERRGPGGRTAEIQRLIGRSLRAALSGFDFGERTIQIDCDVLQADGGTRTAAITGAAVALADACKWIATECKASNPFARLVTAVSVGVVEGNPVLDLPYAEDKVAQVDANIVMAEPDQYVEVQSTAETSPFTRVQLDEMLALAASGTTRLFQEQRRVLGW